MRGRPNLYINYKKETAILSTNTQKIWFVFMIVFSIAMVFIATDYWILLLTTAFLIAVASWGLNIVSGFAGQISLAHGVFVGIGTYTGAVLGGVATDYVVGYELDMIIWLPLSGLFASLLGLLIAPIAVRLKGLNLGLVTLALVFIGSHLFSNLKTFTGGAGLGRKTAKVVLFGFQFDDGFNIGNVILEKNQLLYLFSLLVCILCGLGVKNITRSKTGRAYSAIRDRDIAAEAIGINLFKFKSSAFALSSFYAGIAGSLLFTVSGGVEPGTFNLLYSITFVAIVIIGGVGTVLGPLFGALFFSLLPGTIQTVIHSLENFGQGFALSSGQIERVIFGLFIIIFLIFEPRGLWGIWFRLRNYFKAWPFSY
ncbi:MAG: branched-chain amino acid ABC transporter permease [Actinomycetota bacterium]|nr:branched-chain amino acid ABC transporter permease [Actinomycetota bacterium]MDA3013471.1 branched-chain amino acid ABC transporter permease [Actinomycetota bacterium]